MSGLVAALAALCVFVPMASGAIASADSTSDEPRLSIAVEPDGAALGDTVQVRLEGWPAGLVMVSVCGNGALRGSADCDVVTAAAIPVDDDGTAAAPLTLWEPPVGCPCVVRGTTLSGGLMEITPIELTGVPDLTRAELDTLASPMIAAPDTGRLLVVSARVVSTTGMWGQIGDLLFGGGDRELRLTVRNIGTGPIDEPTLTVTAGRAGGSGAALAAPELHALAPGGEMTVTVPVDLGAVPFGRYLVAGRIEGGAQPVEFAAGTSSWPWGLGAASTFALVAVTVRRRAARATSPDATPRGSLLIRTTGIWCAAMGVAVVGSAAHTVWLSGAGTERAQGELIDQLESRWDPAPDVPAAPGAGSPARRAATPLAATALDAPPDRPAAESRATAVPAQVAPPRGEPLGLLRISRFGDDHAVAVVEGVSSAELAVGPGHYPGTALPGEIGNFVLSGHRTSYSAPFEHADRLEPGDLIELENDVGTFTYRVTHQYLVDPSEVGVLLPVPRQPEATPTEALLTIITCHPKHSTRERLIVEAELVDVGLRA